jgi:alpha-tubulin suppressor-like RCC1 family protein
MRQAFAKPHWALPLLACALASTSARANAATALAVGSIHSCAVVDGAAWCWGQNGRGQLGDGSTSDRLRPSPTMLEAGVVSIAAGGNHSCAVRSDGTLWCWGYNGYGQLGDGTLEERHSPVRVTALGSAVLEVSAGRSHTCARKLDATLWCWGHNADGQLGDDTSIDHSLPLEVTELGTGVAQVAAGVAHTCARKLDGTLRCWGYNGLGALGDATGINRKLPVQVAALGNDVTEVAASAHTCARRSNGSLWCWGWNAYGQLGDTTNFNRFAPHEVSALLLGVTEVSTGWRHTCARKTDGKLRCWGYNADGELGDGTNVNRSFPVVTSLGVTASHVAAGDLHTCAKKSSGDIWCTGFNAYGQLGSGDVLSRNLFAPTAPIAPAAPVAAPASGGFPNALLAALLLAAGMCWTARPQSRKA